LQQLPGATVSADVVDDLVLAVSEAATNAIL
jgi:anti-sigma regulatory factor (Ser/Thr protein kinase)